LLDHSATEPARVRHCRDGYRLAKAQGKPRLTKARSALQNKRVLPGASLAQVRRLYIPFIANLKLTFKSAGHDRLNRPVNGMGT